MILALALPAALAGLVDLDTAVPAARAVDGALLVRFQTRGPLPCPVTLQPGVLASVETGVTRPLELAEPPLTVDADGRSLVLRLPADLAAGTWKLPVAVSAVPPCTPPPTPPSYLTSYTTTFAASPPPASGATTAGATTVTTAATTAGAPSTTAATPGTATTPEGLLLTFLRPAARLALSPAKLVFERVLPWDDDATSRLYVRETSGATGTEPLVLTWMGAVRADGTASDLTVACGGTPTLQGTAPLDLDCAATGGSLGSVTGTLLVRGQSATVADAVPVELRTRLTSWAIPVVTLLGAAFAWLIRERMDGERRLLTERVRARALRDRLDELAASTADRELRDALVALAKTLDAAVADARTDTAVAAAITATETTLDAALATLDRRRLEVKQQLDALPRELGWAWVLPPDVTALLDGLRARAREARDAAGRGDYTAAAGLLSGFDEAAGDFCERARVWADRVDHALRLRPGKGEGKDAAPGIAVYTDWAAEIADDVRTLRQPTQAWRDALAPLHRVWERVERDLPGMVEATRRALADAFAAWEGAPASIAAARDELDAWRIADPASVLDGMGRALRAAHDAFAEVVEAGPLPPGVTKEQVLQAFTRGQFALAVDRVTGASAVAGGARGIVARAAGSPTGGGRGSTPAPTPSPPTALPAPPWGGAADRKRLRDVEGTLRWAVPVLAALVGWSWLDDTWVGTWDQALAAFSWGVVLPTTVDGLIELVKKRVPAELGR